MSEDKLPDVTAYGYWTHVRISLKAKKVLEEYARRRNQSLTKQLDEMVLHAVCGVTTHLRDVRVVPLACGYEPGHGGDHSWSVIPTATELAEALGAREVQKTERPDPWA